MRKISAFGSMLLTLLFLVPLSTFAQAPEMDTLMTKDGKIYVVVAVLVVILLGIFLFLFRMERRLKKLEK